MNSNEPTKTDSTETAEFEPVKSDRIELIGEANRLVECLGMKTILPRMMYHYAEVEPLSSVEQDAYDGALKFLAQQFFNGPRDYTEMFQVKDHYEESVEYPEDKDEEDAKTDNDT